MSTSKPPGTPEADDTPATKSGPVDTDPKAKTIFTVFPRDATAQQIADALNELRRRHSPKR
jgi:hypothetical protein